MSAKAKRCVSCGGTNLIKAIDNEGNHYQGCATCIVVAAPRPSTWPYGELRAPLIRLLWRSVADNGTCTCTDADPCPECQAFRALGYGERWDAAVFGERAAREGAPR